jgi:hypothetical protein
MSSSVMVLVVIIIKPFLSYSMAKLDNSSCFVISLKVYLNFFCVSTSDVLSDVIVRP